MPEQHDSREEEQFGVAPNSIESNLHRMPKDVQDRYRRNRARFDSDQAAMRDWARSGFISSGRVPDDEEPLEEAA